MKVEQVLITPDMAADMLTLNTRNRPLSKAHVKFLEQEMRNGNWRLNGATIILNGDQLIDGQHRLAACVNTGVAIESLVVRDARSDIFDTIDTGRNRTAADTFALMGIANSKLVAAGLRIVYMYLSGVLGSAANGVSKRLSNKDMEELLAEHMGVIDSASYVSGHKLMMLSAGLSTGLHYLFGVRDTELRDQFFSTLYTGRVDGLSQSAATTMMTLRERLISDALHVKNTAGAQANKQQAALLVIKTWNALRAGRELRLLKILSTEPLPTIR